MKIQQKQKVVILPKAEGFEEFEVMTMVLNRLFEPISFVFKQGFDFYLILKTFFRMFGKLHSVYSKGFVTYTYLNKLPIIGSKSLLPYFFGIEKFRNANSILPIPLIQSRGVYLDFSIKSYYNYYKISKFFFSKSNYKSKNFVVKKGDFFQYNKNNKNNRFYFLILLIVTILLYLYRNNPILNNIYIYI